MNYTEIVKKLIGNIQPSGDSGIDHQRMHNLKQMCELVDNLVKEIDRVNYDNNHSQEHSVKTMAQYADSFLTKTLGIAP